MQYQKRGSVVKGAWTLKLKDMNCINRENKNGGGVALYADKNLNYKVVDEMSTAMDNLLECDTVEICTEKKKNIIVSCIYRAPGSNLI